MPNAKLRGLEEHGCTGESPDTVLGEGPTVPTQAEELDS